MIRVGNHVVMQKIGGDHLRICRVAKKQKILIEKLRFEVDGAINQPFGLFEVLAGKVSPVQADNITDIDTAFDLDICTSAPNNPSTSSSCTSLQSAAEKNGVNEAQARQRLTQNEIIKMKGTGVTAEQLVAKLVDGNVSFAERSSHSKHKYINRKAKKHSDRFLILRPTVRLVAEAYYKKDPERVAHLRVDQLSLMLMMGNLRAGSKCLVFEQCSGMLSAAVIDRLGGHGVCVHLHRGNSVQSIPCIESMDFDEKILSAFLPLRIKSLLKGSVDEDSSIERDNPVEKGKMSDETESVFGITSMDCDVNNDDFLADVNPNEDSERRIVRHKVEELALECIQRAELDMILIVTKNVDPVEILEKTWHNLRLSAAIVAYSPVSQPLLAVYQWLKTRGAVQVHICESLCREQQILPSRTRPVMQQFVTGGYMLSAVKVEMRAGIRA